MPALVETAWGHQLIAHPTIQRHRENWCSDTSHPDYELEKCEAVLNEIFLQFGTLNPYALDFPVCMEESEETGAPYTRGLYEVSRAVQRKWLLRHILPGGLRGDAGRALPLDVDARRLTYDPCEEDYMTAYLNLPEVKRALHVSEEVDWSMCSSTTKYRHVDSEVSMVSLYRELLQGPEKLRILVYSGDDDGVCGTVGTQEWIWDMGLEIPAAEDEWQVYSLQEQLVGFHTIWRDVRLGFLTIHGAGHEVPTYRPAVSLDMWEKFLNGYWTG
ncbi:SCPL30, partial [Symbiodinium microadriaticum]